MSYPTLPPPIQNAAKDPAIAEMAKAIRGASVAAWLIAGMLGLVIAETHIFAIRSWMALQKVSAQSVQHLERIKKDQEAIYGRQVSEGASAAAAISRMLSEDPARPRQPPSR